MHGVVVCIKRAPVPGHLKINNKAISYDSVPVKTILLKVEQKSAQCLLPLFESVKFDFANGQVYSIQYFYQKPTKY